MSVLAGDLVALGASAAAVAIAAVFSRRVRRTLLDLAKGPWYVPNEGIAVAAVIVPVAGANPVPAVPNVTFSASFRIVSAVATAIVVLQAGAATAVTDFSARASGAAVSSAHLLRSEV
jgi:hypothetical protein